MLAWPTLLAQERKKASSSAMPSALTYPLLAALVCCTRAGSNMPFSVGALLIMSSNSFLQCQGGGFQNQPLVPNHGKDALFMHAWP